MSGYLAFFAFPFFQGIFDPTPQGNLEVSLDAGAHYPDK